jgi:hypothetical protein
VFTEEISAKSFSVISGKSFAPISKSPIGRAASRSIKWRMALLAGFLTCNPIRSARIAEFTDALFRRCKLRVAANERPLIDRRGQNIGAQ